MHINHLEAWPIARNVHVCRAFLLITDMFSSIFCFLLELGLHDRYWLMDHHTGILYLPEHFISISALFSLGRLQVFIDGPSYRYSIPPRTLYLNLSLIFSREITGIHWWAIISIFYTFCNTLSQSQPYFLVGRLLCLLFLPPNILFIVGLLSTFSHSLISVCWHIIPLTGHPKSIGINY